MLCNLASLEWCRNADDHVGAKCEIRTRRGLSTAPSVCLSVCPSVCPLLTVLVWNRWTIQAEIFRGPSGQVQARIFLKSARSVEIRPSYGQKTAENQFKKRDERVLTGGKNFVPNFLYLLCVSCNSKQISKNLQKKISEKIFEKKFSKKFFEKKNFWKFFEKCLELHETQSKLKKIEVNFFPLKGPLPGLNQIFGICPLIQTWAISRFCGGFRMGWRPPGPPAGVRSLGTRVRAPRRG